MSKSKLNFNKIINRLVLFIVIGVLGHIIFVLSTTERALLQYITKISPVHVIIMAILMLMPWVGYAFRVRMWSTFLGENISLKEALQIVMTADLASALSPTAVGGAPVKAALLLKRGYNPANVGFMLTWGVIEDIVFYITGILLAVFFSQNLVQDIGIKLSQFVVNNIYYILWVLAILLIYILAIKNDWIPRSLRPIYYLPNSIKQKLYEIKVKFFATVQDLGANFSKAWQHGKLRMLASILILFAQWGAKFSVLVVILHAFEIDFGPIQMYIRQWVIYITMLFIPTPGASGGAEASFLLIFGKSIPPEISFLIVSIWRFFTYYYVLIASVILYLMISFITKRNVEVEIETGT